MPCVRDCSQAEGAHVGPAPFLWKATYTGGLIGDCWLAGVSETVAKQKEHILGLHNLCEKQHTLLK